MKEKCSSSNTVNNCSYPCEKKKGHKGYHKNGFHAW